MVQYLMISVGDKGEGRVHIGTKEQILERIYSDPDTGELEGRPIAPGGTFEADTNYWKPGDFLVFKGEHIEPYARGWSLP